MVHIAASLFPLCDSFISGVEVLGKANGGVERGLFLSFLRGGGGGQE